MQALVLRIKAALWLLWPLLALAYAVSLTWWLWWAGPSPSLLPGRIDQFVDLHHPWDGVHVAAGMRPDLGTRGAGQHGLHIDAARAELSLIHISEPTRPY